MDTTGIISITKPIPRVEYEDEGSDDDIEVDEASQQDPRHQEVRANAIVTPGELITSDPVWMKGHGTYFINDKTYSSVVGNISRVNRLLSVNAIRGKYVPETGDHVVGRITEVANKRWKVDIGTKQDAILMLGSVNLPGVSCVVNQRVMSCKCDLF